MMLFSVTNLAQKQVSENNINTVIIGLHMKFTITPLSHTRWLLMLISEQPELQLSLQPLFITHFI